MRDHISVFRGRDGELYLLAFYGYLTNDHKHTWSVFKVNSYERVV